MSKLALKRALIIALVVGTLLNVINQYDAMLSGETLNWLKLLLTYCVPFAVSLFSAWLAKRDAPKVD
ncbi:hypothetical protein FCU94_09490 [Vibrio sp. JPW-9-11-11]|uniref:nitrate/nitrite transporter NrtS n=1 Tax=Vibrio sp. JPW-9-11-11 TaxID=1416532 RepID=UPI0015947DF2|nr:nitrate/nitrite transporter NrtS [Vibrio sp. JPW-9-11-11]NVD07144.1 hypothetical protein [Vibrio sp. JPW-9-11-11]